MAAEVGAEAEPKYHVAAPLSSPGLHKEPPVPVARYRAQHSPLGQPQKPVAGFSHHRVSGSSAFPPLAQAFAPTLGQELAKAHCSGDPPTLSHSSKILLERRWWLCKCHPHFSQCHLLLSLPADTIWLKVAQGTFEQGHQALRVL